MNVCVAWPLPSMKAWWCIALATLVVALLTLPSTVISVSVHTHQRSRLHPLASLTRKYFDLKRFTPFYQPKTSFQQWIETAVYADEDPFLAVRSVIDRLDTDSAASGTLVDADGSFLQLQTRTETETQTQTEAEVERVRSFCEICILVMQMKQRGQPHLCAGLNALHYVTVRLCVCVCVCVCWSHIVTSTVH